MSPPQLTLVTKESLGQSDKVLARRIAQVFESDLAQTYTSGIRFFVQNGRVVVRGLVSNAADQQLLLFVLGRIPGVRQVVNKSRLVKARVYYLAPRLAA